MSHLSPGRIGMVAHPGTEDTSEPAAAGPVPVPRRDRWLVGSLFAAAPVAALVTVRAVWADRQILNPGNFTNMSSRVLADRPVQTALGAFRVTELFKATDAQAEIKNALPVKLRSLAGPVSAGLRQVANNQAPRLLASAPAQAGFQDAGHAAHATFLKIARGGGASAVTGQVVVLRSSQLNLAQRLVWLLAVPAGALPLLTVGLLALAVWLAEGCRPAALRTAGWCLAGIGLSVLPFRRVGGSALISDLVNVQSNRPSAREVWEIATSLLYDIAMGMVVYCLLVVVAAWLARINRPATALRRTLAPTLRDYPARAYAGAGLVFLVLVALGPTPAFRQVIPIALISALLPPGSDLVRRQTGAAFVDAEADDTLRAVRAQL